MISSLGVDTSQRDTFMGLGFNTAYQIPDHKQLSTLKRKLSVILHPGVTATWESTEDQREAEKARLLIDARMNRALAALPDLLLHQKMIQGGNPNAPQDSGKWNQLS